MRHSRLWQVVDAVVVLGCRLAPPSSCAVAAVVVFVTSFVAVVVIIAVVVIVVVGVGVVGCVWRVCNRPPKEVGPRCRP